MMELSSSVGVAYDRAPTPNNNDNEPPLKKQCLTWTNSGASWSESSGPLSLASTPHALQNQSLSPASTAPTNVSQEFSDNVCQKADTPLEVPRASGSLNQSLDGFSDHVHPAISTGQEAVNDAFFNSVVCFGILNHVRAQLDIDPNEIKTKSNLIDDALAFDLVRQQKYFYLKTEDQNIASLSKHTCMGLCDLENFPIEYQALIERSSWVEKIVLYGPRDSADDVGRALSQSQLFLQFPSQAQLKPGYESFNPHWLPINGCSNSADETIEYFKNTEVNPQEEARIAKANLFDETPQVRLLQEAQIDIRVRTTLYSYQKVAVDFILKKEDSSLPPSLNLWQADRNRMGIPYFSHALIRKREAHAPSECEGGILADDMGLGKSLTMLAVIVTTLAQSKSFVTSCDGSCPQRCSATLVVAPSVLILDGWAHEIKEHVLPGVIRVHKYHGSEKEIDLDRLREHDIVLTTFSTIESDARAKGFRFFPRYKWFRIVLDEAHVIRTRTTQQFNAVRAIPGVYRWCLTGTPMQNKLEDFGALINFIRVPYLEERSIFRKHIIQPHDQASPDLTGLQTLLGALCLRRSRHVLELPDPCVNERRLRLSPREKQRYDEIDKICRHSIYSAHQQSSNTAIRKATLRLYLRLRMACNNGTFEHRPPPCENDPLNIDITEENMGNTPQGQCPTCFIDVSASNVHLCDKCSTFLCKQCMPELVARAQIEKLAARKTCGVCQKTFTPRIYSAAEAHFDQLSDAEVDLGISTKMEAILQDIEAHRDQCNSLIFSSWKTSLDLLARILKRRSIPARFIHGQIPIAERRRILSYFQARSKGNVLLMTLGTGAVGLNLFTASRIHVIEPQWNPAVESQAIGRAVRLGQTREVTVIRYLMEDTIEVANVLTNQEGKLELAKGFEMES